VVLTGPGSSGPPLSGRVALVTGAGNGVGRSYAEALAVAGAKVLVADIDQRGAEATAAAIGRAGGDAAAVWTDVRSRESVDVAVQAAIDRWGYVDVLVANAGLHLDQYAVPCSTIEEEKWKELIDVNVTGALRCVQACLDSMRSRQGGCIVLQSSASAYRLGSAYSVSKLALVGLTSALAGELGPEGIRVNAIAPGLVESEAVVTSMSETRRAGIVARQKLRRPGQMSDLTGALIYLASEAGAFVTGQTILVDGGLANRL
jgi:3-oxoacyl-[acyl-carrier protein] reductase